MDRRSAITIWYSVPSILTLLLLKAGSTASDLAALRLVLFAGEVFRSIPRPTMRARAARSVRESLRADRDQRHNVPIACPPRRGGDPPIRSAAVGGSGAEIVLVDEAAVRSRSPGDRASCARVGRPSLRATGADREKTARGFVPDSGPHLSHRRPGVAGRGRRVSAAGRRDRNDQSAAIASSWTRSEIVLLAHPAIREAAVVALAGRS